MDALRKAEQAKQQAQAGAEAAQPAASDKPALQLEPLAADQPKPAEGTKLPELPVQMEALDAEFLAQAPRKPIKPEPALAPPKTQPATRMEAPTAKAQAHNVFAVKQPGGGDRKAFAIVVTAATLLAVAGIGIYFWLQLQPRGGTGLLAPVSPPRPATGLPAQMAAVPPAPISPASAGPSPAPAAATAPVPQAKEPLAPAAQPAAAPTRDAESPVHISRGTLKLNPAVAQGFDAFGRGDLGAAQAAYEQALKADPRNAEALHGLAATALRQGRADAAEALYQRAVEADPQDAVAQAELVGLRSQGEPLAAESRLKSLIAGQPNQPSLYFALGSVYARQARWPEAQQAYFKAFSLEPDNPDYLFNLAVSLDQLHQSKLAAQYYNQAVVAAAQRPAGFDKAQALRRLGELQP